MQARSIINRLALNREYEFCVGWLAGWLAGLLAGWLAGWLAG